LALLKDKDKKSYYSMRTNKITPILANENLKGIDNSPISKRILHSVPFLNQVKPKEIDYPCN